MCLRENNTCVNIYTEYTINDSFYGSFYLDTERLTPQINPVDGGLYVSRLFLSCDYSLSESRTS